MSKLIAIDPGQEHRYIPKDARALSPEDQPVFIITSLTARETSELEDGAADAILPSKEGGQTKMRVLSGGTVLKALMKGLKGWENFKDATGNNVPWRENNGKARQDNLDRIHPSIRKELAEAITEPNNLDGQAEKNSE